MNIDRIPLHVSSNIVLNIARNMQRNAMHIINGALNWNTKSNSCFMFL